ncbi:DNA-binding protein [Polaribacter sp. ALD11]|uniref:helix-turn-helix domain-containing protein n=1 Tax=Polaribacter sp. ALD11 TaxID=2058137 RepID=UPI000C2FFB34|nr:helix-turn-helix domain-containing protein [Polaribacter sp. ALD11]AUC84910.1 DNA-binding protein [Polaribacter sp. ALD11]
MSGNTLYAYSEDQLERIFEKLLQKFNKTSPKYIPQKEIPEEDRLTQQQAAKMLNRSVQTLIKWKKKQKIPFYQIEGTIFYSKSELLAYAKNHPKDFNRL